MAGYQLASFLVKDLQPLLFRFLQYRTVLSLVSSTGNRVEVAVVTDGIVLAYIIFLHLPVGFGRHPVIRGSRQFFSIWNSSEGIRCIRLNPLTFSVRSSHSNTSLFSCSIKSNVRPRRKLYLMYFTTFSISPFESRSDLRQKTGWKYCSFTKVWNSPISKMSPRFSFVISTLSWS